jgi:hypothetical protein
MNSTYTLNEGNDALNRVLLMMRYDLSKTLSENIVVEQKIPTDKDIEKYQKGEYENATRKYVDKTATTFKGPDGRLKSTATSPKMLKDLPASSMTLDEFMEGYRETLNHPAMIGLEIFLVSSGYGVAAVVAAYSVLLVYDIYKGVTTGEWDWLNIIFDILAIVSGGVLTRPLVTIMKSAKNLKLNTIDKVLTYLSKTKLWTKISGFLESSIDILKRMSNGIDEFFKWISEKTGFKFVKNIPSKVKQFLNWIINTLSNFVKKVGKTAKGVVSPTEKTTVKKAAIGGVSIGSAFYVFEKKILPFIKKLSDEEKIVKRGQNKYVDVYIDEIQKQNVNFFPKKINQIVFITNPDDTLNRMTINNNDYQFVNSDINYKVKKI